MARFRRNQSTGRSYHAKRKTPQNHHFSSRAYISKVECPDCDQEEAPGTIIVNDRVIACPTCAGHGDLRETALV